MPVILPVCVGAAAFDSGSVFVHVCYVSIVIPVRLDSQDVIVAKGTVLATVSDVFRDSVLFPVTVVVV